MPDVDVAGAAEHRVGLAMSRSMAAPAVIILKVDPGGNRPLVAIEAVGVGPAVLRDRENLPVDGLITTIIALPPLVSTAC